MTKHPAIRPLLAAALALAGCHSSLAPSPGEAPAARGLLAGSVPVAPTEPAMLRVRQAERVAVPLAEARTPFEPARVPEQLRLNLFEDATFDARLIEAGRRSGALVWRGEILGHEGSRVLLATRGDAMSATIRVDGRLFTIEPRAEGPRVTEWDESLAPGDAPSVEPRRTLPPAATPRTPASLEGIAEIDVLVVYTDEAAASGGGASGVEATVALAIEEANRSFTDSGVAARLRLLDARATSYDESDFDFHQTLLRLALPGDGHLDDAPTWRDELGADHVVLIVDHAGPYAGIGYQMTDTNAAVFAPSAYSVVSRDYATGHYTFVHEIGHNLGANHDPANATDGYRHDARGHQNPSAEYRTVMAYSCPSGYCPRVGQWSNPRVDHEGVPTGVSDVADNARTLNLTAHITAAFRDRVVTPTRPRDARLLTPKDRSTLEPGSVTFEWTDVGAEAYFLMVGRTPGDDAYARFDAGRATRFVAEALPEDGRTLHARLWTRHDGEWGHVDHVFTAHRSAFVGARLEQPGPELDSSWHHFVWDEVEGARGYRLEVGTAGDPGRYFDRAVDGRSALVLGLPIDGGEVVARLHTEGPDGAVVSRSTHRGWRAPEWAARLGHPAHRAPVGSTATFRWTDRGADWHWLVVIAGSDVVFSGPVHDGAQTVRAIPQDAGEVLVLLYSRGPEGWVATTARHPTGG